MDLEKTYLFKKQIIAIYQLLFCFPNISPDNQAIFLFLKKN